MDYIYVVRVSLRGVEQGEFFEEVAYENYNAALKGVGRCLDILGGPWADTPCEFPHVVQRWDNTPDVYRFNAHTVWLEKLEMVGT